MTALVSAPLVAVAPRPVAAAYVPTVATVAGDPLLAGPATQLSMSVREVLPYDGDLLVAADSVIRRVDLETGVSTVFAGIGSGAYATDIGDGGPASRAVFENANGLALGPDGSVYVTEGTGNRLRRIAPDGTITTLAGDRRSQSFSGDGGPATAARMYAPGAVAVAADGTLYVADTVNNRVRRIGTDGIITTIAGNGVAAFAGDGGPAVDASFNQPAGLAVDADGSLLVADAHNHRIRRIEDGVITTVAGIGTAGDPGDGQFGNGVGPNGDGGPATQAVLHEPSSIALDGDGYLIADSLNHKIRRIDAAGVISTVAGGGTRGYGEDDVPATDSSLFAPTDAERLPDGRLVIADTRANRVRVVDAGGVIRALAGNFFPGWSGDYGPAVRAQLHHPHYLTTGPDGDAFVMDPLNHGTVIRRVDAATGTITTAYGAANANDDPPDDSVAVTTYLRGVGGMTVDSSGALFLVDGAVIRRVDPVTGRQRRYAGKVGVRLDTGDGGHRLDATFVRPTGLYAAPDGSLYVSDPGARRVRRIAPDGTVTAFAGNGEQGSGGDGGPATAAQLTTPNTVTGDANGVVYIGDDSAERVRAIDPDGVVTTVVEVGQFGAGRAAPGPASEVAVRPTAVAALPDGTLLVTDMFANAVYRYDPSTRWVSTLAGSGTAGWRDGPAPTARFAFPGQLGYDVLNERVVVADMENARVRAISFPYRSRLRRPALSRYAMAYGMRASILGRVVRGDGVPRAAGTPVTLEFRRNGTTTWVPVKTVTAGLGGWVATTSAPGASGYYRWTWDGAAGPVRSVPSGPVLVRASVAAAWTVTRIGAGGTAYLRGWVRPGTEGQPLVVERLLGGVWHPVDELTAGAGGRFEYEYHAFDSDDPVLRFRRPRDAAHPTAVSPARLLVVE